MNKPCKGTSQYLLHYHIHVLFSYILKIWYDHELTRGHRQIHPGTGAHADVLSPFSARHCRDISLNHVSSQVQHQHAPQFLSDQGLVWWGSLTTQQTTTAGSTGGGVLYLTERIHTLLLKGSHGWLPMASHWNPHFYTHWHKSLLFHGALNIIWDQLFDRNCTSLCTWRFF